MVNELIKAILDGKVNIVRKIIENKPELLNIPSEAGMLPLVLAINKGRADITVALMRANAPGKNKYSYAEILIGYIHEISQDYTYAGWLNDIEYELWDLIQFGNVRSEDPFDFSSIDEEKRKDLQYLSEKCEGWASFIEEEPEYIPLEKWEKMFRQWKEQERA